MPVLFTIGYDAYKSPGLVRLVRELARPDVGVNLLVDARHSPCSSNPGAHPQYGPKDWTLQAGPRGIAHSLESSGIRYLWMSELGNPQKNDPGMAVLRSHLASADERWPVNRGLRYLAPLVADAANRVCLMCVCRRYDHCHRRPVAEALAERFFPGGLTIVNLPHP